MPSSDLNKKKVGLLFGSFNPPTLGHLRMARAIIDREIVDEIWFVLTPNNPHKDETTLAKPTSRFRMLKLMLSGVDDDNEKYKGKLIPFGIEFTLKKPQYTAQTLRAILKNDYNCDFKIIIGTDVFRELHTWKDIDWIAENFSFIIARRDATQIAGSEIMHKLKELKAQGHFSSVIGKIRIVSGWTDKHEYSATEVRHYVKNGICIDAMVHPEVASYIKDNNLYRQSITTNSIVL